MVHYTLVVASNIMWKRMFSMTCHSCAINLSLGCWCCYMYTRITIHYSQCVEKEYTRQYTPASRTSDSGNITGGQERVEWRHVGILEQWWWWDLAIYVYFRATPCYVVDSNQVCGEPFKQYIRDLFQAYSVRRESLIPLQMDCDNTDLLALAVMLWWIYLYPVRSLVPLLYSCLISNHFMKMNIHVGCDLLFVEHPRKDFVVYLCCGD